MSMGMSSYLGSDFPEVRCPVFSLRLTTLSFTKKPPVNLVGCAVLIGVNWGHANVLYQMKVAHQNFPLGYMRVHAGFSSIPKIFFIFPFYLT